MKWFWKTYKINHADDISGTILDAALEDRSGHKTHNIRLMPTDIYAHWKNYKTTK